MSTATSRSRCHRPRTGGCARECSSLRTGRRVPLTPQVVRANRGPARGHHRGADQLRVRIPRTERRRQVDHDEDSDGFAPAHQRQRTGARTRRREPVARGSPAGRVSPAEPCLPEPSHGRRRARPRGEASRCRRPNRRAARGGRPDRSGRPARPRTLGWRSPATRPGSAGLDPAGRREVLDLLDELRTRATIFYSTHLLDDVARLSDTIAVLVRGEVVADGPIDQFTIGDSSSTWRVRLEGVAAAGAFETLARQPWVTRVEPAGSGIATVNTIDRNTAEHALLPVLHGTGAHVAELRPARRSLEDIYFALTDGTNGTDEGRADG